MRCGACGLLASGERRALGGALLLGVGAALLAGGAAGGALGGGARLVGDLVVVHAHQLVDQVAELRGVVHLVAACPTHRRLLVVELLLQDYT